ncbi:MAG TPA: VWA domain-containing protein, partial [Tepidisphaeraceae bacterium]|nr:VWA domain-containing protein [Tepidisphaeraceae bacterium]
IGASSGAFGKGSGAGSGSGDKLGGGTGDGGGALAPFGVPGGGGGIGPKSPFMGVSGNAMKVVYLCDSSGSMMTKFDTLRQELQKAVDGLRPVQAFDIIFFSEDSYIAYDKQLMQAVPENKRKAYEFLEKTFCRGSSDPVPGIKAAFATNPQLIYMLTDGDFPNNTAVIEEIRKLNQGRQQKVKINTIAFMDRGEEYEKLLKQIADENGGMFKFVSDNDLK